MNNVEIPFCAEKLERALKGLKAHACGRKALRTTQWVRHDDGTLAPDIQVCKRDAFLEVERVPEYSGKTRSHKVAAF